MEYTVTLGRSGLKLLAIAHQSLSAIILGSSISILIMMGVKSGLPATQAPYPLDLAIYRLFDLGIVYPFGLMLITAGIYGSFSRWRYFLHYWIIAKWIIIVALFGFMWFWLGMSVNGVIALSEPGGTIAELGPAYQTASHQAFRFTLVATIAAWAIFIVSIWKPWGKRSSKREFRQRTVIIITAVIFISTGIYIAMTTRMLNTYRSMVIQDTDLSGLSDGIYRGEALCGSFTYEAEAEVNGQRIVHLKMTRNRTSQFARYAEGVLPKILRQQNANVDAITGATTTSKCLMKAVETTLRSDNRLK